MMLLLLLSKNSNTKSNHIGSAASVVDADVVDGVIDALNTVE